ncbi:hypothetical protein U9M48_033887 [Paspalum notatum var. saurae]|uniref:Phospholipid/glycerol acyltransferase domain-containing protein n=1 Tax=Paspalum notatum var. saurae TaxID=547442 RepID=A0AAQ3UCG5_PASNO
MDAAAAATSGQRRWLPWARRQAAAYLSAVGGGDDGWAASAASAVRVVACFLAMTVTTAAWAVLMLLLLPWPCERVRQSNVYGHVTGRMLLWILGNPIKVEGLEHLSSTRGVFVCNHASPLDIFLVMWLAPTGTVGIAKKEVGLCLVSVSVGQAGIRFWSAKPESQATLLPPVNLQIIWYPLFGQLYVLANHLRIDRSNPAAAIESMKQVARAVVDNGLSLILFPEGTRSRDGRLLPFKKGFVHAALQTRLPVVPIVVTGTHQAWRNGSVRVRPVPLTVKVLPPIWTDDWEEGRIDEYVDMVRSLYVRNLPDSQKPLDALAAAAARKSD